MKTATENAACLPRTPARRLERGLCLATLVLTLMTGALAAIPSPARAEADGVQTELDALLARTLGAEDAPPHSVILRLEAPQSGFNYAAARGQLRAGSDADIARDDRFYIASISKTMTAVRVLQLAEEGRLSLDATLASLDTFEPQVVSALHQLEGRSYGGDITVRQLLAHRSGLKDYLLDDRSGISSEFEGGVAPGSLAAIWMSQWPQYFSCKESTQGCPAEALPQLYPARAWLPWNAPAFAAHSHDRDAGLLNFYLSEMADAALSVPGTASHYSDTNYLLLGIIIEQLTDSPLAEQLAQGIFRPLGMGESSLGGTGSVDTPASRLSDFWIGDTAFPSSGIDTSWDWGGGGVVSNARDLVRFLQALAEGRLFREASTLQQMLEFIPVRSDADGMQVGYGLGIRYARTEFGPRWGHSGAWGAKMEYFPELGLYVAGTVNAYGTGAEETLLDESVRLFAGHLHSQQ